jgi:hypothetical protein
VKFDRACDPNVAEAIAAAIEAGVPRELIDRELAEAVAGPDDALTEPILTARLLTQARVFRGVTAPAATRARTR